MRRVDDEQRALLELAPWLQNVRMPNGMETAPGHPLGDWPQRPWDGFRHCLPMDMAGMRVLDIGCNAGFYCLEMARRGADVVGLEPNPRYHAQADLVARAWGLRDRLTLRDGQVYDLGRTDKAYDIVLFLARQGLPRNASSSARGGRGGRGFHRPRRPRHRGRVRHRGRRVEGLRRSGRHRGERGP